MNIDLNTILQWFIPKEPDFLKQRIQTSGLSSISDSVIFLSKNNVKEDL